MLLAPIEGERQARKEVQLMNYKIAKVLWIVAVCSIVLGPIAVSFADGDDPAQPGDPEPDLPASRCLTPTTGTLGEIVELVLLGTLHLWL